MKIMRRYMDVINKPDHNELEKLMVMDESVIYSWIDGYATNEFNLGRVKTIVTSDGLPPEAAATRIVEDAIAVVRFAQLLQNERMKGKL